MIRNFYILGNGFDLHHKLPTSLLDFKKIIQKIDKHNHYKNFGVYWTDFEEDLSNLDVDYILSQYTETPDYLSDRESDRDGVIFQMKELLLELKQIREDALYEMIDNAVNILKGKKQINSLRFQGNDIVMNFNYTPTVDLLYNYPPFYIHGAYKKDDLIFGFKHDSEEFKSSNTYLRQNPDSKFLLSTELEKEIEKINKDPSLSEEDKRYMIVDLSIDESQDIDYYIDAQEEAVYDFYNNNKKKFQDKKLIKFLSGLNKDDEYIVYVLGHQMGEIDKIYFEHIEEILNPIQWNITQFNGAPSSSELSVRYSFSNKINFTTITKLGF